MVSEAMVAPMNTPCDQSRACDTSGTVEGRRPPNRMASMTTPSGESHSEAIEGHWSAVTVNREFGCAAGVLEAGVQSLPCQSMR